MVWFEKQKGDVSKTTIFLQVFEVLTLDLLTLSFFFWLFDVSSFVYFHLFLLWLFRKTSLYVLVVASCCFLVSLASFVCFFGGLFFFLGGGLFLL